MRYLLDTNTCIALMRNQPQVVARMQAASPNDCAISTITSFELLTGVEKCDKPAQERLKVETLSQAVTELVFDKSAASESARVRAELEAQGLSIGPYDLLIAGQAVASKLVLVTSNVREFSRVRGLAIEDWQAIAPTTNP
jgi:tRNA(fMet)-specific endonuclease VapC